MDPKARTSHESKEEGHRRARGHRLQMWNFYAGIVTI